MKSRESVRYSCCMFVYVLCIHVTQTSSCLISVLDSRISTELIHEIFSSGVLALEVGVLVRVMYSCNAGMFLSNKFTR